MEDRYILNGVNYPAWFKTLDSDGKIVYNRDRYNKLVSVKITDKYGKKHVAQVGDLIMHHNGAIIVITRAIMKGHVV